MANHYPDLEALQAHVLAFVTTYNLAKHLKALRWRTPFQAVYDAWQANPSIFKIDPHHLMPGPPCTKACARPGRSPGFGGCQEKARYGL